MLMTEVNQHQAYPQAVQEFITIPDAVDYSGYTEQYVRRMARDGYILAVKFGHVWMIHFESLRHYLEQAQKRNKDDRRFGPREKGAASKCDG